MLKLIMNIIFISVAGDGAQDYKGDGGPATAASIYEPNNVAVDNFGNLYIADLITALGK
jgi:hypothetical protein